MKKRADRFYVILALVPVLVLTALFALPLVFNMMKALSGGPEEIKEVFLSPYTWRLLSFTLKESLLSALISVVLAIPFAYFFSTYSFRGRNMILALSALSFTIPSILVVLGFMIFYGRAGVLSMLLTKFFKAPENSVKILYTFSAIIFAHVYLNLPVAFNLITNGWTSLPEKEEDASLLLGSSRMRTFFRITLPKLRGVIINAFVIIFLFCFSSFSIVMVLGGKPEFATLEVEIYRAAHVSLDATRAAALSLFSFMITGALLLLTKSGKRKVIVERARERMRKAKSRGTKFLLFLVSFLMLSFILPPMISILWRSFFTKSGVFSTSAWLEIFSKGKMLDAIVNSLSIALISAAVSTLLAEALAMYTVKSGSWFIPFLATLPLATGSVTLGLGYSFVASLLPVRNMTTDYILILLTHMVLSLPFAIRTLLPGAKEIPERITLASYTLGRSAGETYRRVESPLLRSYRGKAFIFAFALSLGEVNATLTLSGGRITTLPILIYNLIGSYRQQSAAALGSVLLVLAFIVFLIGENLGKGKRNKA